ncbi:MAG: epoxyqueuosine reductase QueH [Oscillospiraceae bacterium]|nr:epoxyqueuosine reductase QueH [Oscillospiraceae bacterium]
MPDNVKERLLLHCCCAPCASYVIEFLMPSYDISLLFYNPNIEPKDEYIKRKDELQAYLQKAALEQSITLLDTEYDNAVFSDAVLSLRKSPEGGERCKLCYRLRLNETAKRAKAGEYDIFATTLSVSPHKNTSLLNDAGEKAAAEFNVKFMQADFKKKDGYLRSIELAKKYNLYRQEYCGCDNEN